MIKRFSILTLAIAATLMLAQVAESPSMNLPYYPTVIPELTRFADIPQTATAKLDFPIKILTPEEEEPIGTVERKITRINDDFYKIKYDKWSEVEIGNLETDDFEPTAKLKKWGDECWIKVKYPTAKKIKPKQEDGKIKWKDDKVEVHFYPLEPREYEEDGHTVRQLEEGGLEFEVILKKKPSTNKIVLNIETKGLNFYYQPELTQKEIEMGTFRPKNVIGSYAVYHATKGNMHPSKEEAEKYKAGKAFHIYRPKIIDSNNWESWGELNINEQAGTLTVTIPQDFIDNAVYPIRHSAGTTLGYSSDGETDYSIANNNGDAESSWSARIGNSWTMPENGTANTGSAFLIATSAEASADTTFFINQKDSGGSGIHGEIDSKETANLTISDTATKYDFTLNDQPLTSEVNYILSVLPNWEDLSIVRVIWVRGDDGTVMDRYFEFLTNVGAYASLKENPWTNASSSGKKYSIYVTYTPDDATAPTISTLSPADDATGVATNANLVITFSEAVDAEAEGDNDNDIVIKKTSDNSTVETIDAQDTNKVSDSGTDTITIDPDTILDEQTGYYVQIGADAFDDAASNDYAGIDDTTTWNFTTVAPGEARRVTDSITELPIKGVNVTLYTAQGMIYTGRAQANPTQSDADGYYSLEADPGMYYITATKGGYEDFKSSIFTVQSPVTQPITMIPLDQSEGKVFSLINTPDKKVASIGDVLTYKIRVTNLSSLSSSTTDDVSVSTSLPHDFRLVKGSVKVAGVNQNDPTNLKGPTFNLGSISASSTKSVTYRAIIGPDAKIGKNKSYAYVTGSISSTSHTQGPAIATVDIREGVFSKMGALIGKVYHDKNKNGKQDKDEPGIPGVAVILDDGTTVITDKHGRYSFPEVSPGIHAVRLDQRMLPGGPLYKEKPKTKTEKPEPLIKRRSLGEWIRERLGRKGK